MKYLLTAFCAFVLFSCSDEDHPVGVPERNSTVIIYISGENSLSSFAPSDLSEMAEASKKIASKNHLVVFYDNASSTEMPYIAELKNGEVVKDKVYDEDFYASDPERMREILTYIMQRWPADDYGIDLWGHASGWLITGDTIASAAKSASRAYGIDNGQNTTSDRGMWINIPTLAKVFSQLPHKFLFLMGDCCFFQCVESAYELKDCVSYIIGSPAEVPGDGAAYGEVIPLMFNEKEDFYKDIIDTWEEFTVSSNYDRLGVPLSCIYTGNAERFAAATARLMPQLLKYDNFADKRLVYYGRPYDDKAQREKIFYDPLNLVMEYAADADPADLAEWKTALGYFVPYKAMATEWLQNTGVDFSTFDVNEQTYSGVSMFVPQPMYESLTPNPNETIKQMKWAKAVGLD
ncbi:MAG: clostripain-related cysteine peptidase [Prevotella sp.]